MLQKTDNINCNNNNLNNNKIKLIAFRTDCSQYSYLKRKLSVSSDRAEEEQERNQNQQQQQQHLQETYEKSDGIEGNNDFGYFICGKRADEEHSKKSYEDKIISDATTPSLTITSSSPITASWPSSSSSPSSRATAIIKPFEESLNSNKLQQFQNKTNTNTHNNNKAINRNVGNSFEINNNFKGSNDGNKNNNGNNNNAIQFNLINNIFINDLFNYDNDNNLIDCSDANNIMPSEGQSSLTELGAAIATAATTFTTASTNPICHAAQYIDDDENGTNWEATDLLELDHRYNSSFQTFNDDQLNVSNTAIATAEPIETTTIEIVNATESETAEAVITTIPTIHNFNGIVSYEQQQRQQQQQSESLTQFIAFQEQHQEKHHHHQQQQQQQQHQHQHQHHLHHHHEQQQIHQSHEHHCLDPQQQFITTSSSPQQLNDNDSDFEENNLSWLLNFKFDDLPHLSPDIGIANCPPPPTNTKLAPETAIAAKTANTQQRAVKRRSYSPATSTHSSEESRSKSPKFLAAKKATSKKFEELVMEVTTESESNEVVANENTVEDYTAKMQKKPPFTYTELIEYALEDKGELTVSGIYQWISDRFPFYKNNDDRWKNSVRHNLSINPHFRKGAKATQGAGHLWTISSGDSAENVLAWEHKKQRLELFFKMESLNRERIQEYQKRLQKQQEDHHYQERQQQKQQQQEQQQLQHQPVEQHCNKTTTAPHQQQQHECSPEGSSYDEAAAAAAAITEEMLQQSSTISSPPNISNTMTSCNRTARDLGHGFHELHGLNDLLNDEELRRTAGQILNGIHREVEVQSVNSIISTYHDVVLDSDYLNPIHKDIVVNESGLRNVCHNHNTQYYLTDLDPIELGIQMSHQVEEEPLFNDDFNLNYLSYNTTNNNDITA